MTAPDPRVLALRRAAGALLVVADTRDAVRRWLDGNGRKPSLATFADDRAAAISALSEALRIAPASPWEWLPGYLTALGEALEVGLLAEKASDGATYCDRWASWIEANEGGTPDAAAA